MGCRSGGRCQPGHLTLLQRAHSSIYGDCDDDGDGDDDGDDDGDGDGDGDDDGDGDSDDDGGQV